MSEFTGTLLHLSFPVGDSGAAESREERGREATLRFLCERAEAALDEVSTVVLASARLRESGLKIGTQDTRSARTRPLPTREH